MSLRSSAFVLLALAALSPLSASSTAAASELSPKEQSFTTATRHLPASTPLADLELYSMEVPATSASAAQAALSVEIERLYTHAKTLASGPERRALETRIYQFERRLRPLASAFNVTTWETLRADVRAEWVSIQGAVSVPQALAAAS